MTSRVTTFIIVGPKELAVTLVIGTIAGGDSEGGGGGGSYHYTTVKIACSHHHNKDVRNLNAFCLDRNKNLPLTRKIIAYFSGS